MVRLAVALVKHQAKTHLGDEFVRELSQQGLTLAGDELADKLGNLFEDSDKAGQVLLAF